MTCTDFWWFTPEQAKQYSFVELVHHQSLTENDDPPYQNFNSPDLKEIQSIFAWSNVYHNTNVYRSLTVWSDSSRSKALSGPLVIDIDNEDVDNDNNLDDTLEVTQKVIQILLDSFRLLKTDLRVFFSGHKGFNIEVFPTSNALAGMTSVQQKSEYIRTNIISQLRQNAGLTSQDKNIVSGRGSLLDPAHDYVRLHGSINKWIENGRYRCRKKTVLTLNELNNMSIEQIVARSTT